jgi:hypothetical protein
MDTVWIRTHKDVLIRANSVVILESQPNGLYAECITGSRVQITQGACSLASQLTLLEEIQLARADESRAAVITPAWEQGLVIWHRETF